MHPVGWLAKHGSVTRRDASDLLRAARLVQRAPAHREVDGRGRRVGGQRQAARPCRRAIAKPCSIVQEDSLLDAATEHRTRAVPAPRSEVAEPGRRRPGPCTRRAAGRPLASPRVHHVRRCGRTERPARSGGRGDRPRGTRRARRPRSHRRQRSRALLAPATGRRADRAGAGVRRRTPGQPRRARRRRQAAERAAGRPGVVPPGAGRDRTDHPGDAGVPGVRLERRPHRDAGEVRRPRPGTPDAGRVGRAAPGARGTRWWVHRTRLFRPAWLVRRPPPRSLDSGRPDRSRQPRAAVPAPPRPGARRCGVERVLRPGGTTDRARRPGTKRGIAAKRGSWSTRARG